MPCLQPAVAFDQRSDAGLAQGGDRQEVEGVERFPLWQPCSGKMTLDAALFPLAQLQLAQRRQQAFGRPTLLVGTGAELRPEAGNRGQPERRQ